MYFIRAAPLATYCNHFIIAYFLLWGYFMKLKFLNTVLVNRRIPLTAVFDNLKLSLLKISEIREFKDGSYTDRIIGYTYECGEAHTFKTLTIKIEGQSEPLMSNDMLQEQRRTGLDVYVEFQNPTILAYVNERKQSLEDSIKADGVQLAATTELTI